MDTTELHRQELAPASPSRPWVFTLLSLATLIASCGGGGGATGNGGGGGGGGGGNRGGGLGKNLNVTPTVIVENNSGQARTETIRATIPFTETMVRSLENVGVRNIGTAWVPMQQWPDGSVKVAQAQFTDTLPPNTTKTYEIVKDVTAASGSFEAHPWVTSRGSQLRIGARVTDTFDVAYQAEIGDATPVTIQETYLVRVQRYRVYHRATGAPGIGRDFLASTFYVTQFRDMPFVTVDWVLGNDYLGADDTTGKTDPNYFPLATIDVNRAMFLVRGVQDAQPYLKAKHGVGDLVVDQSGWATFQVMENTYIDDCQTRRYRFHLRIENPNASAGEKQAWRDTFAAGLEAPLFPLADLKSWQQTGALGLFGGPLTGAADATHRAIADYHSWDGASTRFGTWGDFGDVKETATTGTPRNHPISPELAHAIQGGYPQLLQVLEQMAWAQAIRPFHMFGLEVGSEEGVLLWDMPPVFPNSRDLSPESFGRRKIWRVSDPYAAYRTRVEWNFNIRAHGFTPYDTEHMSVDLLFDYWTASGDAWAKDELRQMGQCLKGTMRLTNSSTMYMQAARAEGWCMQAFVQCYLATGDDSLKQHAVRRIVDIIDPQSMKWHASKCLSMMGPYAGTGFPGDNRFYMAWQHGAVLYGMLAAHQFFGCETALRLAENVVASVEYSWVSNYNDPKLGFVPDGLRYYCPLYLDGNPVAPNVFDASVGVKWGDSPLGGAHGFLIGGLFLVSIATPDEGISIKALNYGRKLLGDLDAYSGARYYKWNMVVPEHLAK